MKKINLQCYLRKEMSKFEVENLLVKVLGIVPVKITSLDSSSAHYNLQTYPYGDFRSNVDLYLETDLAESRQLLEDLDLALKIADLLNDQVIISDHKLNPLTWLLVNQRGEVNEVTQVVNEEDFLNIKEQWLLSNE